jgi:CubicO group peptidase (beta-lactamase class C family)
LPREADIPYWTDHVFPSREQLAAVVVDLDAVYAPETTYHYSNLGMALLGEVVTQVSGTSWADYVQEKILDPLGMVSSSAAPEDGLLRRRATPYMRRSRDGNRGVFVYYDTGAIAPAANMVSTVEDLCRFASLQFRDGPAGNQQILKGSTLREMQRVHWVYDSFSGGRGLGFYVSRRAGKTFVGHGGWIGGNRTHLVFEPDEKIAVIAALNADDGIPYLFTQQAYDVVAPAILHAIGSKPEASPPEPDSAWQSYLGLYSDPWGWETEVLILGGELVMYSRDYPPDDDASAGFTRLTPVEGATFRMPDNELVTFEVDENGQVKRIKRRNDYLFPQDGD